MIGLGSFRSASCLGLSRRAFVQAGLAAPAALGLGSPALGSPAGKARSVLLVWLWGGPSHIDTFDPKPNAPAEYRGPFAAIPTRTPGVYFSELLPQLAKRSDRFSLVRSNVNRSQDHLEAGSIGLTAGFQGKGGHPPNFGSILARERIKRGMAGELPPFISLAKGPVSDGRGPMLGYGGGLWGKAYDPFLVGCSETGAVDVPGLKLIRGLSPQRLGERRELLVRLDAIRRAADEQQTLGVWDETFDRAYGLLASPEGCKALDLSSEPARIRELYGQTSFGQSCLLGRRLVEAGVPYVQVNWSQFVEVLFPFTDYGWDTHSYNFELLSDWHAPLLDRVFSVLLDDLEERGLLETTLVVCLGEFGRTPRINEIGSRDHWPDCYCSIWAGAGVKPGRTIGESDARGERPLSDPIYPEIVGTTMLELAGVTSEARAELRVLPGGRVLHELL